ncbi:hypothetical protein GCM10022293_51990 [Azospirillum formosense]
MGRGQLRDWSGILKSPPIGVVTGTVAARQSRDYLARMPPLSYARHQFPPAVIRHAIWLYLRFTLSCRDVEELLAERGVEVSCETVRRWVLKFGPAISRAQAIADRQAATAAA